MKYASFPRRQIVRNKAADLFTQNISNAEIGRRLGVSRQTISGWRQDWQKQGIDGLVIGTPGQKPRLTDEQWKEIAEALLAGPEANGYDTQLWTLKRIADLIRSRTGVSYNSNYVWELLKDRGWSCRKPERRAKERDEEAITAWKAKGWTQVKKGHRKAMPR